MKNGHDKLAVYISPEAHKVLAEIAKRDHRTLGGEVEHLVKQAAGPDAATTDQPQPTASP